MFDLSPLFAGTIELNTEASVSIGGIGGVVVVVVVNEIFIS